MEHIQQFMQRFFSFGGFGDASKSVPGVYCSGILEFSQSWRSSFCFFEAKLFFDTKKAIQNNGLTMVQCFLL